MAAFNVGYSKFLGNNWALLRALVCPGYSSSRRLSSFSGMADVNLASRCIEPFGIALRQA